MLKRAVKMILDEISKNEEFLEELEIEYSTLKGQSEQIDAYEKALSSFNYEKADNHDTNIICILIVIVSIIAALFIPKDIVLTPYLANYVFLGSGIGVSVMLKILTRTDYLNAKLKFDEHNVPGIEELVSNKENILLRMSEIKELEKEINGQNAEYNKELKFASNHDDMMDRIKRDFPNAFVDPFLVGNNNKEDLLRMFDEYINEYINPSDVRFLPSEEKKLILKEK